MELRRSSRLKNRQTTDETNECLSVKKTKKDTQTEEHRCHSEGVITRAVLVKKTKKDTQMEEHGCHSEDAITGAGSVKRTKVSTNHLQKESQRL